MTLLGPRSQVDFGVNLLIWSMWCTSKDGSLLIGSSDMSEIIISEVISRRRALSLVGLAAALGLAAPAAVLMASDAEAQTSGMERRQERRTGRTERREERRTGSPPE
jgi:hypothetical protein